MLPDGTYTGVVDSIEDGLATIFLERDGEEVDDRILDAERLPETARHQDAIVNVTVEDDEMVEMTYDAEQTEQRQDAAQSRFDRLSKRSPKDEE